ncbi:MAG: hypothetical protein OEY77_06695 [Nitrospira sp.]|nr:hypothetical protein [Nitrospira sp.]
MADVSRYLTAGEIINRAAVEVGLAPVVDAFASADPAFRQLRTLITSCGQTLIQDYPWQRLHALFELVTDSADSGEYELPADFSYMLDQTGWQRGGPAVWPLLGPASPQVWSYLKARQLYSATLYVWFRISDGKFNVFPDDPVPDGIPITFEYVSRAWVIGDGDDGPESRKDKVTEDADIVLFEPILIINFLKLKFLAAKGFDTTDAKNEFSLSIESWKGKDNSAPVLNAGRPFQGMRYLDSRNVPETGFGG